MATGNIEIEIKVRVEDEHTLVNFLEKQGTFHGEHHQVDEYYMPAHKDYLAVRPANEWLRLRTSDGTASIAYKNWHRNSNGTSSYCDEIETGVESFDQLGKIFDAIDMKSLAVVDKIRKAWHYGEYEIVIDAVKDLGTFVEVEYIGTDASVDADGVVAGMVSFLKETGCGKVERTETGYPFLIMFPEEADFKEI